jgi:PemK-like protein.
MPSFKQGDVVRVPFPYTDRATRQRRPALVVSHGGVGEDGRLLWVAMITSVENRAWADDASFGELYREAGLPAPSVVRPSKLATIEASRAEPIGSVPAGLLEAIMATIRGYLGAA